jgi:hypothetical protein
MNNHESHKNGAAQHNDPNINSGMEHSIAGGGSQQTRRGAERAECKVTLFHPVAGNDQQPQKNR